MRTRIGIALRTGGRGDYMAQWRREGERWRIRSELFVALEPAVVRESR